MRIMLKLLCNAEVVWKSFTTVVYCCRWIVYTEQCVFHFNMYVLAVSLIICECVDVFSLVSVYCILTVCQYI